MDNFKIINNKKISSLTTFKTGGKALFFCSPKNTNELKNAFDFSKKHQTAFYFFGGGSNLLISDSGINGLIISSKNLNHIAISSNNKIIVQSGVSIKRLNQFAIKNSLSGLEFSGGLPGTIGGAVYMNARAYNNEFSNIVESVKTVSTDGKITILNKNDLNFSYKKSIFMENPDLFIYEITLNLTKEKKKNIKTEYLKNLKDRISKGQFKYPSAGCIFKNNYEKCIVTGKLIDELGLKGLKYGGAQVYKKHGNFIINRKNATSDDIKKLIEIIEHTALEKKNITLEREIRLLGF